MTIEEVAYGFIKVANAAMCRPIRSITVAKGYDTRDHILSCFGGAGILLNYFKKKKVLNMLVQLQNH
jgi:N-methylhydantoinase A/oxoprolinase/acetone carboxylase beta subunit